jgi:hypothetical protein
MEGDLLVKKREHLELLRKEFEDIYNSREYPLDVEIIDTSYELDSSIYKNLINKSLMLENKASQINKLNYRGHITPHSKYLIYSSLPLDKIQYFIYKMERAKTKDFGFLYSRDIENNPVNIHSLSNISNCESVFVIGKDAIQDYKQAENKTGAIYCNTLHEFFKLFIHC